MESKECSKCRRNLALRFFSKCSARKDGLQNYCKDCARVKTASWQELNAAQYKKLLRDWKAANPVDSGRYYESTKKWRSKNPHLSAFYNAWRRFVEAEQTIPLSEAQKNEMKLIYAEARRITKETGVAHHVDHIFPLAGGNCSGLHVPWNLQIIPATENVRKSNKVPHDRAACKFLGLSV